MIALDTNYLVRFFTRDIENQAELAKKLIENTKDVYISAIVLAETAYILQNHYQVSKIDLVNRLLSLVKQPNIKIPSFALLTLEIYRLENISFYDCLLVAEAVSLGMEVKSFDEKLMKVFLKYRSK